MSSPAQKPSPSKEYILTRGKKGEGDTVIQILSDGEVFSFYELLFLLDHYFQSEDSYYPKKEGNLGRGMLLSAICTLAVGVDLDTVARRFMIPIRELKIRDLRPKEGI